MHNKPDEKGNPGYWYQCKRSDNIDRQLWDKQQTEQWKSQYPPPTNISQFHVMIRIDEVFNELLKFPPVVLTVFDPANESRILFQYTIQIDTFNTM